VIQQVGCLGLALSNNATYNAATQLWSDASIASPLVIVGSITRAYQLQEGSGDVVYNTVANANHGSIEGTLGDQWDLRCTVTKDACVEGGALVDAGAVIPILSGGTSYANGAAIGSDPANEIPANKANPYSLIDPNPFDAPELAVIAASAPYASSVDVSAVDVPNSKFVRTGSNLERDRWLSFTP
jgi:hypothetical protein